MTKQELKSFRAAAREIDQINYTLEHMRSDLGIKVAALPGDSMRPKSIDSPVETIIERYESLEAVYEERIAEHVEEQHRIELCLRVLTSDEAAVLRSYYINRLTWEAVACELHYSYQHVHRLHASALIKLKEL